MPSGFPNLRKHKHAAEKLGNPEIAKLAFHSIGTDMSQSYITKERPLVGSERAGT
jgi:hypothetical protein